MIINLFLKRAVPIFIPFLFSCTLHEPALNPKVTNIPFEHPMGAGLDNSPLMPLARAASTDRVNRATLLNIGEQALLARIHLIRAATLSIDIQTLIWSNDETGRYLMYELIAAANRGVRVRIIVDHIASERDAAVAAYLASVHPGLKIKVYNPVGTLGFRDKIEPSRVEMAGGILTRFNRTNQRMHNKIFIVDGIIGITGGRNCENTYFDQALALNFKDRDALVAGPVVTEMSDSFEDYWGYKWSVDIAELADVACLRQSGDFRTWNSKADFALHGFFDAMDQAANDPVIIKARFSDGMQPVDNARIIVDAPGKNKKKWFRRFRGAGKITVELAELISQAENSILIQTPYLVLSNPAIALFKELRQRRPDLDIRISTNSLAATDSWHTYAISFQQKQIYLEALGFKIYEFKPRPGNIRLLMPSWDALRVRERQPSNPSAATWVPVPEDPHPTDSPYLCLHAKSMVIDDEIVFIGSYNLDPRSENLNTEVGLIIRDRQLARSLTKNISIDMQPGNAWVIAKSDYPAVIEETNAILEVFSRMLPIVDPWPLRYAGSYELKQDHQAVEPGHPDFYRNYRSAGSFPQVGIQRLDKIMGTWMLKTFGGFTKPLL